MNLVFRLFVALVVAVSTFLFVYWVPFSVIPGLDAMPGIASLVSMISALIVGWYIWRRSDSVAGGFLNSVITGAVVMGAVGFAAGFFGPILFTPEANQGPLLGIFVTGPLGFVIGGIAGGIHWFARGRERKTP